VNTRCGRPRSAWLSGGFRFGCERYNGGVSRILAFVHRFGVDFVVNSVDCLT
jgi:hypothetical protein